LRIFFFKLCKFLREAPVMMIFVFDGPNRPSFKHGRQIDTKTVLEWSNICKTIIEAFGFHWNQVVSQSMAPGEAEAELAIMSYYNAIDAVLTSDSDCLVFGAQCVLRRYAPKPQSDRYLLYSIDAIKNMAEVLLSRGGLLLVALLSKGDYSDGFPGCGIRIATSLARGGFGDRILHAFDRLEGFKLDTELKAITNSIQTELFSNSCGHLGSSHPSLA
ncbi:PIN domain-like protein, partial [Flammula alnicola]